MAIDIHRVGRIWPKRYLATVTPPHGDWRSPRPESRRAIQRRLYAVGNHSTDIGDAFSAANAVWGENR